MLFLRKIKKFEGHAAICRALGYPVVNIQNPLPGKGDVALCDILQSREEKWRERCDEIFAEALAEVSGQEAIAERVVADGEAAKKAVLRRG